jgi:hypothetical protein
MFREEKMDNPGTSLNISLKMPYALHWKPEFKIDFISNYYSYVCIWILYRGARDVGMKSGAISEICCDLGRFCL